MAALDDLSLTFRPLFNWTAKLNVAGLQPATKIDEVGSPVFTLSKAIANNLLGGGDQVLAAILEVPVSSNLDTDLTAFTDLFARSAQSLARVKLLFFWLMSATDTLGSVTGTACSQVTIGNAASNPFLMELGGTTPTKIMKNGDFCIYGNRTAAGLTVGGTNKVIRLANADAVNIGKVFTVVGGGTS